MNTRTLFLAILIMISTNAVHALQISGVDIADNYEVPGSEVQLVLNGAGIRKKFFMDIYIGALYLPATTPDAAAILSDTGPVSILMHFLYSEVSKGKITGGWDDGLSDNLSAEELQPLNDRLEKFNNLFRTVTRDDEIRIDYIPESGTNVRINGEWRGSVEGNDFFRALLRIWLGTSPVSKSLKREMLGNN